MPNRRIVLKGLTGAALGAVAFSTYAFGVEPGFRLVVTDYALTPDRWPRDLPLTVAVIADIHASEPHMSLARVRHIVETTNALGADLIVLLGDFMTSNRFVTRHVLPDEWGPVLGLLKAPLGVHSVLGNHDWWHGPVPGAPPDGARGVREALKAAGITVLENDALRLAKNGRPFWLLGLGDQIAYVLGPRRFRGVDDLPGTLAKVTDDAPIILLAHEPDIFPRVPARVSLTLAGHTHGGQVRILGYSPIVPSEFGNRFAYGLVQEDGRSMIVSGGLGTSIMPVRLGVPPEIVTVRLGGAPALA
ncbi:metallophosphoesterase [Chelatococcus sp. SYSU_G07232]|uniref:Metallophosphoesterase n=1 Tax=Chelatococcus albus TaxID=3047466 RepID=A0ABT7AGH4_9HYPH|nr:metallophosphoesterase [Chelatococcus sp. SYSU_G07232]MDJ1157736.1 metallophosphoesterase [Chelatococcus sp. SYSU_G07232]